LVKRRFRKSAASGPATSITPRSDRRAVGIVVDQVLLLIAIRVYLTYAALG
jgi:hypothetical protein